jgi:hypothetical protein
MLQTMNNNGINGRIILTGWLLLLLFALPPAAKNIHVCRHVCSHEIDRDRDDNGSCTHHDCESCMICQFVIFPFTGTQSTEIVRAVETVYSKSYIYQERNDSCIVYNYMLRAPPCA